MPISTLVPLCGVDPDRTHPTLLRISFDDSIAVRYGSGVIRSFKDSRTEKVWNREPVRAFGPDLQRAAQKKLRLINAASELNSLRVPPGNRLEKLAGDRSGQHSIRINDQYRICFVWTDAGAEDVEITDYH